MSVKQQRMFLLRDAVRYQREAAVVFWTKNPRHAAWCEKMASKTFEQAAKLYD